MTVPNFQLANQKPCLLSSDMKSLTCYDHDIMLMHLAEFSLAMEVLTVYYIYRSRQNANHGSTKFPLIATKAYHKRTTRYKYPKKTFTNVLGKYQVVLS